MARKRTGQDRPRKGSPGQRQSRIRAFIVAASRRKRQKPLPRLPRPLPYFRDLTPAQRDIRGRVFHAVSLYRRSIAGKLREPISLSAALRQAGTTRNSLLKFPGLYTLRPDGSIRIKQGDRYKRQVPILIPLKYREGDTRTIYVYSSREASIAGQYMNAVRKFLAGKAGPQILREFTDVTVGGYKLLTNAAAIKRMALAGKIRIDQFGSGQELRGDQ